MTQLVLAAVAFVGTHFLMSHPLRAPMVARLGEQGFLGLYSLVSLATLVWLALAFRGAPVQAPMWPVGDGLWLAVSLLTYGASVLFVGSLRGNPAMPNAAGTLNIPEPRGVFSVTRHPMMWGFGLWGIAHMLVSPTPADFVLAGAIAFLALVGARLQDRKKEALQPEAWRRWEAQTSYLPFAAIAAGRVKFTPAGVVPVMGGMALWLVASWAHLLLIGMPAGLWRWLG